MGVSVDDGGKARGLGLKVEIGEAMQQVKAEVARGAADELAGPRISLRGERDLGDLGGGKKLGPVVGVHVAAHGHDGSDLSQIAQDLPVAHVSGVKDELAAGEGATASGRSRPCVSLMTPIFIG